MSEIVGGLWAFVCTHVCVCVYPAHAQTENRARGSLRKTCWVLSVCVVGGMLACAPLSHALEISQSASDHFGPTRRLLPGVS